MSLGWSPRPTLEDLCWKKPARYDDGRGTGVIEVLVAEELVLALGLELPLNDGQTRQSCEGGA